MPDAALPEGRYLSCALRISFDAGGQTRALLMRNRNLVRAGVRPDLIVLGAPDLTGRASRCWAVRLRDLENRVRESPAAS